MARRLVLCLLLGGALALPQAPAGAAGPPQIGATWVTEVTASSANLRAEISPNGAPSTYHFDYLTQAQYEANLKAAKEPFAGAAKAPPSGSAPFKATESVQHISDLNPATFYRFRAVASNALGTTNGPERGLGTQEATNAFHPLDDRGWEMVSPIDKNGGAIQAPETIFGGGVFQAAPNGQSLTYSSADSFAGGLGAPPGSQYLASRTASAWSTQNITAPLQSGGYGDHPDGVPYQLFSQDLSRGLMLDSHHCTEGEACPRSYSLHQLPSSSATSSPQLSGLRFEGASADLGHVVLSASEGLYEWGGEGPLAQLSATPGAALAAPSGAISQDGSHVYFTELEDGPIYLAQAGKANKPIAATIGAAAAFQLASSNGRYAFFTKGAHLYRWDATNEAEVDIAGEVQGVLGGSEDGSRIYYLSASGLFLWEEGVTTKVAAGAASSNYPPATGTARVSADGTHLLFLSAEELSGYENNGQMEVFLSGPAGLSCVSCNPTGERPEGSASIPAAISNGQLAGAFAGYKPRALSADGNRVFFDSFDDLVPQDSNKDQDVYEWEAQGEGNCAKAGGCTQLISSGRGEGSASLIDASADGADAFFLTDASLNPADPGSFDLYVAREGGGFPLPPNTIACEGDACQPLPEAPEDPTPGTLVANGGNPAPRLLKLSEEKQRKGGKKKHHHKRHRGQHGGKK